MERVFSLSFLLVAPFWLLMIFAPRWSVTERIVRSPWIAAPAAVLYLVLIAPMFPEVFFQIARPELGPVAQLLGTPAGATIGWIHFLAFDLLVAGWIFLDARERKLSSWFVSPILYVVLMFGPIGFFTYLVFRTIAGRLAAPVVQPSFGGQS